VGTLGEWQLAVSRHSPHPALAADLVRFLTSAEVQRQRALAATMVPTRPALFQDPAIAAALPFLGLLADGALELVARPSTVTGASYPQVSELLQQGLSRLLDGRESSEDMLTALVAALEGMSEGGLRW
jgi:trehalose/maltose transport system substrate-binding protein